MINVKKSKNIVSTERKEMKNKLNNEKEEE